MTLDNSLINDTFMYPYAMEYNTPLTPVYNFNYNSCSNSIASNNNNNNNRMVSFQSPVKDIFIQVKSRDLIHSIR